MPKAPEQHRRIPIGKTHQIAATHKPRERRGSARDRGYSSKWDKFAKLFLQRNPLCEFCKARGHIEPSTVCDHDLPHEQDRALFWNNTFTALCTSCHSGTKQSMERRFKGTHLLDAIAKAKGETNG